MPLDPIELLPAPAPAPPEVGEDPPDDGPLLPLFEAADRSPNRLVLPLIAPRLEGAAPAAFGLAAALEVCGAPVLAPAPPVAAEPEDGLADEPADDGEPPPRELDAFEPPPPELPPPPCPPRP